MEWQKRGGSGERVRKELQKGKYVASQIALNGMRETNKTQLTNVSK